MSVARWRGTAGMDNLIALVDRTELNALVIDSQK